MCGIVGIWEYGAEEGRVELSLVEKMRDTMPHRGPDDAGTHIFDKGRGGFGHRRLSIVDLSEAGHQPMRGCASRDVWLTFNGEIYNHSEIRADLEKRGHVYASQTDSETIIHLYEERGVDFVHEIEGDFAIALWNEENETLSLYRDRLGVKPLYFYNKDGRFIFASEIKAILAHPSVTPDVDENSLVDYLSFLAAPAPHTLFKNIQKLPIGHRLIVKRNGDVKSEPYWDALPTKGIEDRTEQEHCEEILRLLRDSIKKRMMSDVPFGVFLSGGVDSSANVALMSELMTRPVETFTVGFHEHEYLNELDSARRIAKLFQTNHHEVIIGETELKNFLPELVFHQDEPLADPVCVPLYYVSKLARDSGTIVIQTGEGADEIFSGYDKYVSYLKIYEKFWKHAEKTPASLRRAVSTLAQPVLEAVKTKRMAVELARRLGANEPLFWGAGIVYDESLKKKILSAQMKKRTNGHSSLSVIREYLETFERYNPQSDFLSEMIYVELKLRLPELLLTRIDKITMASSIEARVPFLDHHLVEYSLGVPRKFKVVGKSGKHILKRALEPILPNDLLYAQKRGFGAPIREWFRSGLGEWFDEYVLHSTMVSRKFFDYRFIERMLDEHRRESFDWSFHLWALLNLSLWYERWIDPR
jgi:asparagine synthase (glutamine-hydrolysing)